MQTRYSPLKSTPENFPQVPLEVYATKLHKNLMLKFGFNAFCYHIQPHMTSDRDHRLNQGMFLGVIEFSDKGSVNLYLIERQVFKISQG